MSSHSSVYLFLLALLGTATSLPSATKEQDFPDREMLRMMEFLRDMEMLKRLDMMRDLPKIESVGDQAKNNSPRTSSPAPKKESSK